MSHQCKIAHFTRFSAGPSPVVLGLPYVYDPLVSGGNFIELPGLHVSIDRVRFNPFATVPIDRPYCFVYFITIHNDSEQAVTIKARKWVVTNARGEIVAVEGEGVVGQYPELNPGEKFSYNSFHLLDTPLGVAEGSYIGLDEAQRKVLVRIPRFELIAPPTAQ